MGLIYKIKRKGVSLLVKLTEKGSKRILYLDTLKAIASPSDQEALSLLVKIHLRSNRNPATLNFQEIDIPAPYQSIVLALLAKTGRVVDESELVVAQKPLEVFPKLILKDSSGSFANLWMDYEIDLVAFEDFAPMVKGRARLKEKEKQWESDLLECGYIRKTVGGSHYYCPSENVMTSLQLLLDVGWKIEDMRGEQLKKIEVLEEKGMIAIRSAVRGMIDPKIQMEGVWEGETLYVKKNRIGSAVPLLSQANWEESLRLLAEGFKNGDSIREAPPSPLFKGVLLPYQQKGVNWLSFLYSSGLSGLLADEMGLGKTVQVLAFLSRLDPNMEILIVAPTSLLFNWSAEIDKFLPGRQKITLTSYTLLRLNEKDFVDRDFEVIILDESHAIKTVTTQTAKSACKLKGNFRIALSGTPMENRLDELWSQFHFLNPNLIERKADIETVKRRIAPFILRRCKEEVQLDLPDKIEQIAWVEMDEGQRELYESYKKGDVANRMQVLEAILRMRQVCLDPRLVGSDIRGAKIELLISDVQDALEQKRKILVYSQFTSMLQLIQNEFPGSILLDGSTPAERRGDFVKRFQEDPNCPLFLLSLKAGGVGLNLTAADYVLLFDPWWNDAVERQAIDRAHRIGQKKTVIAKRYLTVGSIEEKMLQLKVKKQQAADQLFDLEGWTEEDLLFLMT